MKIIKVQFYDLDNYLSEIGGIWKIITGIAGIFLLPLLKYYFFNDMCIFFNKDKWNKKQMSNKIKQTFSYEKMYDQKI